MKPLPRIAMRKQYHLRSSPSGLLAWDVDRLIELTAGLPRVEVPLETIRELDEPFWFGGGSEAATCRAVADHARLIQETDLRYPVILGADGRVMDGMHRVAKAYLQGRATILAVRLDVDPEPDYVGVDEESLPYERAAEVGAAGKQTRGDPMKMYILVRDDVPLGFAMVAVAHASLAGYLAFRDTPEVEEWLSGRFFKAVCVVNAKEFENAKAVPDHVVLTESALGDREVAIAFKPRNEWPKMFRFLKLYREPPAAAPGPAAEGP